MADAVRRNPLMDRLRAGEPTLMMGIRGGRTSEVVRIAKATGHHAILVDLEHCSMPVALAVEMCATASDLGMTPFVRIPEREYGIIGRLLDGGAVGLVAPRVESVAEAETFSRACRFPPHGQRSQLAMVPQFGMRPMPARELNPLLDESTVVKVLLETPDAIDQADAIAALPGVDLLAIGANDLCAELGIPGQYGDPLLRRYVRIAADACRKHGKLLMLGGVGDLEILAGLMELGVCPLLMTGTDTDMLFTAAQQRSTRFNDWYTQTRKAAAAKN